MKTLFSGVLSLHYYSGQFRVSWSFCDGAKEEVCASLPVSDWNLGGCFSRHSGRPPCSISDRVSDKAGNLRLGLWDST